ncbi:MAG: hypothetical protein ACYDCF_10800 [Burkholderiales bacterium]
MKMAQFRRYGAGLVTPHQKANLWQAYKNAGPTGGFRFVARGIRAISGIFDTKDQGGSQPLGRSAGKDALRAEQTPERFVKRLRDQEYRLADALDRYATEILPGKKPSTQKRDLGILKVLKADCGEVALTKIDGQLLAAMIRQWQGRSVPILSASI